ncbi:fumarylacetoacetate hydrolase family protein [filamentous cyanobacterium LEGE 11480]|uniref:Fumarylacetoacetate hydrolase family protein n=1 Tax=Romeriopsis navalis LEGE 11480 TaxID=2777977 RepID=A0A928VQA9_9CYAN|nr:fumarylacetoacetate hydrolase family protein [Romeriopsis navalis]MBE9030956.1 fumarylacetoacetate hydrolase family protein [Romeriopsis navalis LEGE 11480]
MAKRYVRLKTFDQQIFYGLFQIDHTVQTLDAPPWLNGLPTEQILAPEDYELLAPCVPSKIIAIGKNYAKHAAEMGTPLPQAPLIFLKPPTAVIPHKAAILYPPQSTQVEYEGELAIVIGDKASQCTVEHAHSKIWGYTIANDVTARDLQQQDGQWIRAKGFDSFCPLGPWMVREVNPGATLQTYLNGEPRQESSISDMVFSPDFLVSYVSQIMTLWPGDVILTGTPEGVGAMQIGDRVQVEIEGIGTLENVVEQRPQPLQAPMNVEEEQGES